MRYELGEYWVEFNYGADLSRDILELFKDKDLTKWLKDLANTLSEEPEPEEEVNEYQTSF